MGDRWAIRKSSSVAPDRNGDGKIDKDEAPDRLKENIARIDANGDGAVG